MKKLGILLILVSAVFSCATEEKTVEIYVSPNSGVNADGSKNRPFETLDKAILQAGTLKSTAPNTPIVINILPGEYHLTTPISISTTLSGLHIKGAGASEVSIKGSVPLELSWEAFNDSIFVAQVPKGLDFDQFTVNDTPQILARYPNYDEGARYWQGYASDALSKERIASWKKPEGTYFNVLHKGRWGGFHYRITGLNDDGTPILEGGHQNNRPSKPHLEYRMVENVFEELDSPGEWYLDTDTDKLYYWPLKNMDLNTSSFEGAVQKDLIQVVGTLEAPVTDVTISGIKFEQTKRTFMEPYEPLLRSDWTIYRGAVLFFEGTENVLVENCEFTNLGGNVIMASKYNKDFQVKGNHIHDCGASAVSFVGDASAVRSPSFQYKEFVPIAEMDTVAGPQNELYPRASLVEDNLIYRIGRTEKQTAGVQISMAMDITVRHNSIYDVPRAGINIGDGTWGGHVLEFNDVFNTVLETSDHGSFNSWGRDRFWHPDRAKMDSMTTARPDMYKWDAIHTTIIRNNRFRCDHGWDVDLDDGSSNYHIYNNLLLNNGLKFREGFHRVAENNIMVNNSFHPHVWFTHSGDVFIKNIVQKAYQDIRLEGWGKELDYNLFPNEESMMKSQIHNRDMHSAFGDPRFRDPSHLDFTVLPNSPALELGFQNFPMDEFGVQQPKLKALAKTPEVPVIDAQDYNEGNSHVVEWLRNSLKNVESEQEQSAYGLNTTEGIIVLQVWDKSPAVMNNGLKKGDVILSAAGTKVKNVKDFFKIQGENRQATTMKLVIMRNQTEKNLTINLK